MKVIKNNLVEEVWPKQFTCGRCKSILEAELSDVDAGYFGGGYAEQGDWRYHLTCPVCSYQLIFIAADLLPANIRMALAIRDKHRNPHLA